MCRQKSSRERCPDGSESENLRGEPEPGASSAKFRQAGELDPGDGERTVGPCDSLTPNIINVSPFVSSAPVSSARRRPLPVDPPSPDRPRPDPARAETMTSFRYPAHSDGTGEWGNPLG